MTKKQKGSKTLAELLKKLGVKMVTSKVRGAWSKKLKLKAIDQAIKLGKLRPIRGSFVEMSDDADLNPILDTAHFCAVGCLAAVTGHRLKSGWDQFSGTNPADRLEAKTFDGDGGNLSDVVRINDLDGRGGNSTVRALKFLRKQIEKE